MAKVLCKWTPANSLPLSACFLLVSILFTVGFTSLIYVTMNNAALSSVNSVSDRLHVFVMKQLKSNIEFIFSEMTLALEEWWASEIMLVANITQLQRFEFNILNGSDYLNGMALVQGDGLMAGAIKMASGQVIALDRPVGLGVNTTYRPCFAENGSVSNEVFASMDADMRLRPWYKNAEIHHATYFTTPYYVPIPGTLVIALSMPIYDNKVPRQLASVLVVTTPFQYFVAPLEAALSALQSTGMLFILGNMDEAPVAVVSSQPESVNLDIQEARNSIAKLGCQDSSISSISLSSFGKSFLLMVQIRQSNKKVGGIDWKLYAVLPERDYFDKIWHNNRLVAIYISIILIMFECVLALMFFLLITRPLNALSSQVDSLKKTILDSPNQTVGRFVQFRSPFREIRRLFFSVMDAIEAAEHMAATRLALQNSEKEALSMVRAKDMFFAVISHEMRTPLTCCIGMSEILLETTELDSRQRECITSIFTSSTAMLCMVNDILDFSKIQSGQLALECFHFDVRECVEEILAIVQFKADEKGLVLVFSNHHSVPKQCSGDKMRLGQVLLNLLNNAVKFTLKGSVVITCTTDVNRTMLQFAVQDTGIGMDEECIQNLFQPFVQADASMCRKFGGTGLGLAISKKLVEQMGGTMTAYSEGEGYGSRFSFSIPVDLRGHRGPDSPSGRKFSAGTFPCLSISATVEELIELPVSNTCEPNLVVLVVDSIPVRRNALCEMLEELRLDYRAFETLEHLESNHMCSSSVSLSLSFSSSPAHMSFPVMSERFRYGRVLAFVSDFLVSFSAGPSTTSSAIPPGIEQRISLAASLFAGQCKLVWITTVKHEVAPKSPSSSAGSSSSSSTSSTSTKPGHITLPLTMAKLREAMQVIPTMPKDPSIAAALSTAYLQGREKKGDLVAAKEATLRTYLESARILIVDDVFTNRRVLELKLQRKGCKSIDFAANGKEAVAATVGNPTEMFNLILMDAMMPEMDGLTATKHIRQDPRYVQVPIIGITGNCTMSELERCVESGMTAAIGKPIDSNRLYNLIGDLIPQEK